MTLSQQSIDKIIKLRRQGLLRYKIAEIVGCSACTVGKYCKQYELQQPQLMESVVSLILLE
jgi:predicted transcriptional regulator